jgi:hypothetical protein
MASKTVKLTVRLPEDIYLQLVDKAKQNDRSANAEVLRCIRYSVDWKMFERHMKNRGWTPPNGGKLAVWSGFLVYLVRYLHYAESL